MKRPNPILYLFLGFLLRIYGFFKGQRIHKHTKIKRPAIVLSNHTSFHDFVYTTTAIYPNRISYLAADKMFYDPVLGPFLRMARAIPKCLYQTDPIATMKAFRILKKRGIVGIFPEGQISPIGVTLEFGQSIAKLVKKAKVSVYVARHKGAYLVNPPWTKKSFAGRIETDVELILSPEDIMNLDIIQIQKRINENLIFNTHEYNETKKMKVKLNSVKNLESVIYHCPNCGQDELESTEKALYCPRCKSEFIYDQYGRIGKYRMDLLYQEQERLIAKLYQDNPDYLMESEVKLEGYRNKKVEEVGSGTLKLGLSGYYFEGILDGKETIYHFSPMNIGSLPSDIGLNVQIYQDYKLYQFVFDNRRIPTQFVIAGEYIYREFHKSVNAQK